MLPTLRAEREGDGFVVSPSVVDVGLLLGYAFLALLTLHLSHLRNTNHLVEWFFFCFVVVPNSGFSGASAITVS